MAIQQGERQPTALTLVVVIPVVAKICMITSVVVGAAVMTSIAGVKTNVTCHVSTLWGCTVTIFCDNYL